MPVFVPVSYCLDVCGFVVEPEVRQVESSSSILLSQDRFGYSSFFLYFHTNLEIICSSSVKNVAGSLIVGDFNTPLTPMDSLSSTKEARIYNGVKTISLTSGAGKTGQKLVKE